MTREDKQGIGILVLVLLSLALLFGVKHAITVAANNIDPETLCRIGEDDPAVKLLVDKTDPWDQHGQQRLASLIRTIKSRLRPHERLSIFILDETGTYSPSPVFDMCNPGRGDQANELYQNPRRIQQKFAEQFAAPLDAVLDTLLTPGSAPRSPLIETVKGLRGGNAQERLIMVSDMMQNSEELSFYGHNPIALKNNQKNICTMADPYQSIEVYAINRPSISVRKKQQSRNFWNMCLEKAAWETKWNTL